MPEEKPLQETDGNPKTEYEDTKAHSRTGFMASEDMTEDADGQNPESTKP